MDELSSVPGDDLLPGSVEGGSIPGLVQNEGDFKPGEVEEGILPGQVNDREPEKDNLQRSSHSLKDQSNYEGPNGSRRQSGLSGWEDVKEMMPSHRDRASGKLSFRRTLRRSKKSYQEEEDNQSLLIQGEEEEEKQPKTSAEVLERLVKLREQPWPLRLKKQKKNELKQLLESLGNKWHGGGPVVSIIESGTNNIQNIVNSLDPVHRMLKRIEGNHGASVVAVFNFIRDMIRLNLALALLLLCGIVIPSSIFVGENDQTFGWYIQGGGCSNTEREDLCSILQLTSNSSLQECNQNYTNKVEEDVKSHSSNWIAVLRDFLQGTGFLEWSILFSGYYPTLVESSNFLVGLAYLLTVLVTYIISLVFVVHFVAKFLRKTSSFVGDYGMTFSRILFTGWDFTVRESAAAKIESSLFVCEIKAAYDDEEHTRRSLQRTRNENIKLIFGRIFINLIIIVLIGGSWAGIYFLVKESQRHTQDTGISQFVWEYAPTLTVAGLNIIFPTVFTFFVSYEQYKGRTELFLTLSRCVLVRLTSLGILIITKISLINNKGHVCNVNDEFICWETHLGQQVYSILILDAIIQVGMTLVVNVLRWSLRRFNNAFCQKIGTMEFFVPGHVLDVVYIQAVCWIGLLYSPLIVTVCLIYFCLIFFLKLFTVSVTCIPASRVFRASRSSAMFMTILALAFLVSLVPNALALLYLCPSLACSPFRGLGYAWEVLTYYICNLSGSAYWIRSFLFALDGTIVCTTLLMIVLLCAVYYISVFIARGVLIRDLETKLKNANRDKKYLMDEFLKAKGLSDAT